MPKKCKRVEVVIIKTGTCSAQPASSPTHPSPAVRILTLLNYALFSLLHVCLPEQQSKVKQYKPEVH
jgi:hypothetical protein